MDRLSDNYLIFLELSEFVKASDNFGIAMDRLSQKALAKQQAM